MRSLFLAFVFTAFAAVASAQPIAVPGQVFAWSHSGVGVETFQLVIDGQPGVDIPGGAAAREVDIPALTPGQHTWAIDSCNIAGCARSEVKTFTLVVVPEPATDLEIRAKTPAQ